MDPLHMQRRWLEDIAEDLGRRREAQQYRELREVGGAQGATLTIDEVFNMCTILYE